MGWIVMSLRALRYARLTAVGLAMLVLVTAFVFALAPTALTTIADDALRSEVQGADARERNIQLTQERRVRPDLRGTFAGVEELGRRFEEEMPAGVVDLVADRSFLVDTPRWSLLAGTTAEATVAFRWQPDARSRIRFVAGREPRGELTAVSMPASDDAPATTVLAIEGALSAEAATDLQVEAGDTLLLTLDPNDRMTAGHGMRRMALLVTGIFSVDDPTETFWLGDRSLEIPPVRAVSADDEYFDALALVPDEAYQPFMALTEDDQLPLRYRWRWYVDPDRLATATVDQILLDLRRLDGIYGTAASTSGERQPPALQSGLLRIVSDQVARWRSAEVILAVVFLGPAVVAAAAIALVGALAARRRQATLATWRGRGASTIQLVTSLVIDGLIVAVPAAVLAAILVVVLIPAGSVAAAGLAAALVAVAAVVLLVAAARPTRVRFPGDAEREAGVTRPASARRLVLEATIVGLALVGAYLLRERGVTGASSAGELTGADPLIAAVPALVGVAAGIVAIRLAPLPLALLAGMAAARRGLVPVLGLRRATRSGAGGPVLLVLLATATLAAFSAATLLQIARSAETVAWLETGAPFRIDSDRPLPADLGAADLPGASVVARAYDEDVQIPSRGGRARALILETVEYQAVVSDTPIEVRFPIELLSTGGSSVPAIVSSALAGGRDPLVVGDPIDFVIGATPVSAVVAEIRDDFPALPGTDRFIVLPRVPLAAVYPTADLPATTLFVRAPDTALEDLRVAVSDVDPGATVEGREERTRELLTSPVVAALVVGAVAAAIVTAIYAALAVAAALVLAGAARAIETAHLRTLGLTRRGAVGLLVVELGPIVIVAFVLGAILGLGLFALLQPGLGIDAILGSPTDLPLVVEPGPLVLVLAAAIAIVAVGLTLAAIVQSRAVPALAIRGGIES